jgi:hypothetical protein
MIFVVVGVNVVRGGGCARGKLFWPFRSASISARGEPGDS